MKILKYMKNNYILKMLLLALNINKSFVNYFQQHY